MLQYTEHSPADSVQDLHDDQKRWVGDHGEQQGPDRQSTEPNEQQRTAPPGFGLPTRPRRAQCDEDLGHDDESGYDERGTASLAMSKGSANQWQYRSIDDLKQEQATRKDQQVAVLPKCPAADSGWPCGVVVIGCAA